MSRLKKCVICGEFIQIDEQSVPYKNRSAHQRCFDIAMKTISKEKCSQLNLVAERKRRTKTSTAKPPVELKDGLSEEEYAKKQKYYAYLRNLIGDEEMSAKVYALTEDYLKRYKFTYVSMYQTLLYLNEITEKELTGDVVGLIPYYHTEATRYFESVEKVTESNKDKDIDEMYIHRTIVVKPSHKKVKQIDIESIGADGE